MAPSPEEGLFQDIREHPHDDTPRLVYADWLEEQGGDPARWQAELIRVQCRLARLPEEDPARPAMVQRESGLLSQLGSPWPASLQDVVEDWEVRRGFVERLDVTTEQLLTHGELIVRLAPIAEWSLTLSADDLEAVLNCPHLRHVTRLEGRGAGFGDEGAHRLGASPWMGRLRLLVLHNCRITEAGFVSLLKLDLSRLTTLNLGANDLHNAGMELLCQAPDLANLETLGLGANELYLPAAQALAQSPYLRRLREINLGANYFDDNAITVLAEAENLASLHRLDVRDNEFHSPGARALARSPHLEGLHFLDVSNNRIGQPGRAALRERFGDRVQF